MCDLSGGASLRASTRARAICDTAVAATLCMLKPGFVGPFSGHFVGHLHERQSCWVALAAVRGSLLRMLWWERPNSGAMQAIKPGKQFFCCGGAWRAAHKLYTVPSAMGGLQYEWHARDSWEVYSCRSLA